MAKKKSNIVVLTRGCELCIVNTRTKLSRMGYSSKSDYTIINITNNKKEYKDIMEDYPKLKSASRVAVLYNPDTLEYMDLYGVKVNDKIKAKVKRIFDGDTDSDV